MIDISATAQGSEPADQVTGPEYWIRLTSDPPPVPETVSKIDFAKELDSLFGVADHCTGEKVAGAPAASAGSESLAEYAHDNLSGSGCQEMATALGVSRNCAMDRRLGNPLVKNVYAHCSSEKLRADYALRSIGSAIVLSGPSPGNTVVRVELEFSDASYAPVRYYADHDDVHDLWSIRGYQPQWVGPVLSGITRINQLSPKWSSGNILLGAEVSGMLVIYLPIQYDTWTVSIPGTVVGDKRSYNSTFIAASQYLDDPAEVTIEDETDEDPQADDCSVCGGGYGPLSVDIDDFGPEALAAYLASLVRSGGDLVAPARPIPPEKDWATEIGCCGPDSRFEYYPLQVMEFGGYDDLEQDVKDQFKRRYGEDTRFVGLSPTNPPCGKLYYIRDAEDCCAENEPLNFPKGANQETIAPSTQAVIAVFGGVLPITWTVAGGDATFLDGTTVAKGSMSRMAEIIVPATSCGAITVTAIDECGSAKISIRSTNGEWQLISDTIQDSHGLVDCIDGEYAYVDDYCTKNDEVNSCTGQGRQLCPAPDPLPEGYDEIEGNSTSAWVCPS